MEGAADALMYYKDDHETPLKVTHYCTILSTVRKEKAIKLLHVCEMRSTSLLVI